MLAAGCANDTAVQHFIDRAVSLGEKGYDWNLVNQDGKNVYDLVDQHGACGSIWRKLQVLVDDGAMVYNVPHTKSSSANQRRKDGYLNPARIARLAMRGPEHWQRQRQPTTHGSGSGSGIGRGAWAAAEAYKQTK